MMKKLENFWYHYKWHTIVAVFLVAVGIFSAWQLVSAPDYDYQIMLYTSRSDTTALSTALQQEISKIGDDLNADGEVTVQIMNVSYSEMDQNQSFVNSHAQALRGELLSNRCFLIITDDDRFKQLSQEGYFEPLENTAQSYKIDDNSNFGKNILSRFQEMNYKYAGDIENGLNFSLRYPVRDSEETTKTRENQKQLLYKIKEVG